MAEHSLKNSWQVIEVFAYGFIGVLVVFGWLYNFWSHRHCRYGFGYLYQYLLKINQGQYNMRKPSTVQINARTQLARVYSTVTLRAFWMLSSCLFFFFLLELWAITFGEEGIIWIMKILYNFSIQLAYMKLSEKNRRKIWYWLSIKYKAIINYVCINSNQL